MLPLNLKKFGIYYGNIEYLVGHKRRKSDFNNKIFHLSSMKRKSHIFSRFPIRNEQKISTFVWHKN